MRNNATRAAEQTLLPGVCFLKPQGSAVVVVIANVVSKQSLRMAFAESDEVVEPIAAAAPHPALGNPVL
jgi:hypothetical protein